jgi:hypothetical protein
MDLRYGAGLMGFSLNSKFGISHKKWFLAATCFLATLLVVAELDRSMHTYFAKRWIKRREW